MSKTRKVTVAAGEVTTKDGKTHKQGSSPTLPDIEARDLIRAGLARAADPKPSTTATTEQRGA